MTRDDRPGLQIKVVEALACGRAIIARKGSMRGLPDEKGCWIEVETPAEMLAAAGRLQRDEGQRRALADAAKEYYRRHLDHDTVIANLKSAYSGLAGSPATAGRR
jgi:glycosyltransferase involved in cell wall biosynthesis